MSKSKALRKFLNARCPHGYSARKYCSRCQSANAAAQGASKSGGPRRSVYDRP